MYLNRKLSIFTLVNSHIQKSKTAEFPDLALSLLTHALTFSTAFQNLKQKNLFCVNCKKDHLCARGNDEKVSHCCHIEFLKSEFRFIWFGKFDERRHARRWQHQSYDGSIALKYRAQRVFSCERI